MKTGATFKTAIACTAFSTVALFSGGVNAVDGTGFMALIEMTTNATLDGNVNIVGVHLHTGAETVNGPINIIYCMGSPLPAGSWPNCGSLLSNTQTEGGMFHGTFLAKQSMGAWPQPNVGTSVANATTLAEGAATTYETFMQALEMCTEEFCDVYFNWHTSYSFSMNPGFGLGRAQLSPLSACPVHVEGSAKCYGTRGEVMSENTNMVDGIKNPLPMNAGSAKVLIVVPNDMTTDTNTVTISNPTDMNTPVRRHLRQVSKLH